PYEDRKQESGVTLKIIGFWVDIIKGSISLTPESIQVLVSEIDAFLSSPLRKAALRDRQRLAGSLNWSLNVLPWARPALNEMYRKMSGKTLQIRAIPINGEVHRDLTWFSDLLQNAIGIRFVDSQTWEDSMADFVGWTDASNTGLSFVYAGNGFCYQLHSTEGKTPVDIFFRELLAILSLLHHIASKPTPPRHILIHSDSLDSVEVPNSLSAREQSHNAILLAISAIVLKTGVDLRVRHIAGKKNIKADLLSRLLIEDYKLQFPSDCVRLFEPPRSYCRCDGESPFRGPGRAQAPEWTSARPPMDLNKLDDLFYPHFDQSRSDPLVQATIRGSKKIRADPVNRKPPLRTAHIKVFYDQRHNSCNDLLFATIVSCAFSGCHRIGELIVPNQKSLFDWRKIIKRSSLKLEARHAGYQLPYHKADPFYQG
ncbi:hypothetical protein BT96DRAFT_801590, partial [Gymnopus androsaceus JB14]